MSVEPVWTLLADPPRSVDPEIEQRVKRIIPVAQAGGVVIGLVCGYIATIVATTIRLTPTAWSTTQLIELFLAVAVPVCLAEFFLGPRILRWLSKASQLHVRSLQVTDGKLRVGLAAGRPFDVPLERLRISTVPVSDGWYRISVPAGRTSYRFYVQTEIAGRLQSLVPRSG